MIKESEKLLVKRLWNEGESVENIIRLLPYSIGKARRYVRELRESGYLEGSVYRKGKKNIEKYIELYKSGMSVKEIASMYGLKVGTIYCYLKINKNNLRDKRYGHGEKTKEIINAIKIGKKQCEVVKEYGVSRQYVSALKKEIVEKENG